MATRTKKRATQDRSEATKEKLLAATLSVILRDGWSGASTLKICDEAQVSNGAQTHHFPKKNDLLLAALKHNRDEMQGQTAQRLDRTTNDTSSISDFVDVLRLTKQDESYFYATLESLIAARTDEPLREELQDIDTEWIQSLRSASKRNVGALPDGLSAEDITELTLYLVRGMVVQRGVHQDNKHLDKLFALWRTLLERATVPSS